MVFFIKLENKKIKYFLLSLFFILYSLLNSSKLKLSVASNMLVVSTNKIDIFAYNTDTYNIRSSSYAHKPRPVKFDYVNNISSLNVLVTINNSDGALNIICSINERQTNRIVQSAVSMLASNSSMQSQIVSGTVKQLSVYNVPFEHGKEYVICIQAINSNSLLSEVCSWSVVADLTRPKFENTKIEVVQTKTDTDIKHNVYWGRVIEDVSSVNQLELYYRTGENPKWTLQKLVSINSTGTEVSGLLSNTSYFYKVRALNTAGIYSDYLVKEDPVSTGVPGKVLTSLSNYPNPFNSNIENTTIYYYLNAEIGRAHV